MRIAIGCDHAGYVVKEKIKEYLSSKSIFKITDVGTHSLDSVDYPEFGHKVGLKVSNGDVDNGIVVCGSGIGISIAANKINGVRAALCTSKEQAEMSRKHNDANILALGARMTSLVDIYGIIDIWFETAFENGRHLKRIKLIEL